VLAAIWNGVDYPYGLWLLLLAAYATAKVFKLNARIAQPPQPPANDRRINSRQVECAAKLFILKAPQRRFKFVLIH
jgi:hypothetical protein